MTGPRTKLTCSRSEAAALLDGQIAAGGALVFGLPQRAIIPGNLDERFPKFDSWHQRNQLLLESMFSDGSLLDQYRAVMLVTGTGDQSRMTAHNKNVERLVGKLQTIRDNLDLIPELGEEVDPGGVAARPCRPPRWMSMTATRGVKRR